MFSNMPQREKKALRKELAEIKKKLLIIKNTDSIILKALELYKKAYPEYSADALTTMIADETGHCRATIYNKKAANSAQNKPFIF